MTMTPRDERPDASSTPDIPATPAAPQNAADDPRDLRGDESLLQRITALVDEEHRLRGSADRPTQQADRLRAVEEELDQLWDLLRQRRARREFGEDPQGAQMRDRDTVERYLN